MLLIIFRNVEKGNLGLRSTLVDHKWEAIKSIYIPLAYYNIQISINRPTILNTFFKKVSKVLNVQNFNSST